MATSIIRAWTESGRRPVIIRRKSSAWPSFGSGRTSRCPLRIRSYVATIVPNWATSRRAFRMFAARVVSSRSGSKLYMYETAVRRTSIGGACSGIERSSRRTDGGRVRAVARSVFAFWSSSRFVGRRGPPSGGRPCLSPQERLLARIGDAKVGAILKLNVSRDGRTSQRDPQDCIRHHPDEEEGEVDPGELVACPRGLRVRMGDELRGQDEERDAGDHGDAEVDRIERRREDERDARNGHDCRGAGDRQRRRPFAPDRREHREPCPPVILAASVREGPKVSRRPQEDQQGDEDCLEADRI